MGSTESSWIEIGMNRSAVKYLCQEASKHGQQKKDSGEQNPSLQLRSRISWSFVGNIL